MKTDLARLAEAAHKDVKLQWDGARQDRVRVGMERKRRRRQVTGKVALAAGVLMLLGGGALALRGELRQPRGADVATTPAPQVPTPATAIAAIVLKDGTKILPLDDATDVRIRSDELQVGETDLLRGAAAFDVVRNPARVFRVHVGPVTIEVLGTFFRVAREPQTVRVSVETGRVRVSAPLEVRELTTGEIGTFALAPPPSERPKPVRAAAKPTRWRSLVKDGRYSEAYQELRAVGQAAVEDVAVVLMEAADAARLSGHPEAALEYLRRVSEHHQADPLAPLAAFTMGRLLLDELGKPAEAAEAFVATRRFAPEGSLAQDALARQVEAHSKAGQGEQAHAAAALYLELFPTGRRLQAVKRFGGLE